MTRYVGSHHHDDLHGLCEGGRLGAESGERVLQVRKVLVERNAAPQCVGECGLERLQRHFHLEEVAREVGNGDGGG